MNVTGKESRHDIRVGRKPMTDAVMPRWQGARYQNDRFFFFPPRQGSVDDPSLLSSLTVAVVVVVPGTFFFYL